VTRRTFAALAAPALGASQGKIRAAMIGTGHGHAHSKILALQSMAGCEFVGVCRPDKDEPAIGPAFEKVRWLAEDEIPGDASIEMVAMEFADAELNLQFAQRCVDAGKWVHLDKPPGATAAGLQYTRYADDLAFSGSAVSDAFIARVGAIVYEEGFAVQFRKTRLMRQGVRQHLAELVVNAVCNVKREDFDRLKATLYNCVKKGPEGESRDVLAGRVGFVESVNPAKGRKLRVLLDRILWAG